jgi:hypothetical protein
MKFRNSEQAILYGQQATRQDCKNLTRAIKIFSLQYSHLGSREKTLENFKKMMEVATWHQLCREALEVAIYEN